MARSASSQDWSDYLHNLLQILFSTAGTWRQGADDLRVGVFPGRMLCAQAASSACGRTEQGRTHAEPEPNT